jgi:hypothetical protein
MTTKAEIKNAVDDIAKLAKTILVRPDSYGEFAALNRKIGALISMVDHLPDDQAR